MTKLTPFQQALATNMGQEKLDSDNPSYTCKKKISFRRSCIDKRTVRKLLI